MLASAKRGEGRALESLYSMTASMVVGYLRVQGAEDPEDLTSEVFLGAFRNLDGFNGDDRAWRTWVLSIAHRRMVDERRRRARRPATVSVEESEASLRSVDDSREGGSPSAEEQAIQRMGSDEVQALCATLADDQRDVLLLRLVADLTVDQAAEALGKSPGAVKALQRRGIESLRRRLSGELSPTGVTL